MAAINRQIDEAHKMLRQKADDTLNSISENYQSALMEKIGEELELSKQARSVGNSRQADVHELRADIYRSALDAVKRGDRR
jgi:hypothetical protein